MYCSFFCAGIFFCGSSIFYWNFFFLICNRLIYNMLKENIDRHICWLHSISRGTLTYYHLYFPIFVAVWCVVQCPPSRDFTLCGFLNNDFLWAIKKVLRKKMKRSLDIFIPLWWTYGSPLLWKSSSSTTIFAKSFLVLY